LLNNYKYDIAISLCNQDVDFARSLVKAINPSLKVFFYEDKQEELISKSGPEAFSKIFKEESRIIVVLSRNEWSESFYTEIEKNAIIDRTAGKNQGYNFLMIIPMEPDQIPSWYPSTRIYADPRRFTIELLAKFIEFKVVEFGGVIIPVTAEEFAANFVERLNAKRNLINLQHTSLAIEAIELEINRIKKLFNEKVQYFKEHKHIFYSEHMEFTVFFMYASFGLGNYLLRCDIQGWDWGRNRYNIGNTQNVSLLLKIIKKQDSRNSDCKSEQYKFYFSETSQGWSIPVPYEGSKVYQQQHLYREDHTEIWYDLKSPDSSEALIDKWFTELWKYVSSEFNEII